MTPISCQCYSWSQLANVSKSGGRCWQGSCTSSTRLPSERVIDFWCKNPYEALWPGLLVLWYGRALLHERRSVIVLALIHRYAKAGWVWIKVSLGRIVWIEWVYIRTDGEAEYIGDLSRCDCWSRITAGRVQITAITLDDMACQEGRSKDRWQDPPIRPEALPASNDVSASQKLAFSVWIERAHGT